LFVQTRRTGINGKSEMVPYAFELSAAAPDPHEKSQAPDPTQARREFQRLFPRDFVIGVKEAAGWDGRTLQGGRWLA
jgi:hypothetical protein